MAAKNRGIRRRRLPRAPRRASRHAPTRVERMHRRHGSRTIARGYFKNVMDGCANDELMTHVLARAPNRGDTLGKVSYNVRALPRSLTRKICAAARLSWHRRNSRRNRDFCRLIFFIPVGPSGTCTAAARASSASSVIRCYQNRRWRIIGWRLLQCMGRELGRSIPLLVISGSNLLCCTTRHSLQRCGIV